MANKNSKIVSDISCKSYLGKIIELSDKNLKIIFNDDRYYEFISEIKKFDDSSLETEKIVDLFSKTYEKFVKEDYQKETTLHRNDKLMNFINETSHDLKIVWGDVYEVLRQMDSESIHLMVTSPPYYNAREYSQWDDMDEYLSDMRKIIKECYRVLDNHRIFVFNIGDVFDNDNLKTRSVWGKRRLPLGAYFIKIFEEEGFTFVDDIIWDKGEVQSQRHKSGDKPYPFYQYPLNCYEHLLIFHKHRLDKTRFPCPICGGLKVNGNTQSEIGLQSWECKNYDCFQRSESNRGKRFSLKTNLTQRNHTKENEIEEELIKKWRRDIVRFNPVIKINSKGKNTLGHSAPFPEDIPEMAIKFFTYPGEKVLDPFGGSFTSAVVAKKLGRIGIGAEINKEMFKDVILRRIQGDFGDLKFVKEFDVNTNEIEKPKKFTTLDNFVK